MVEVLYVGFVVSTAKQSESLQHLLCALHKVYSSEQTNVNLTNETNKL